MQPLKLACRRRWWEVCLSVSRTASDRLPDRQVPVIEQLVGHLNTILPILPIYSRIDVLDPLLCFSSRPLRIPLLNLHIGMSDSTVYLHSNLATRVAERIERHIASPKILRFPDLDVRLVHLIAPEECLLASDLLKNVADLKSAFRGVPIQLDLIR
jgi:hypothetical protein